MLRLVRSMELSESDLIYPIFIREDGKKYAIESMKGQEYFGLEEAVEKCEEVYELGLPAVMVFGVITGKDDEASVALQKDGFHSQIFRRLKSAFGEKLVLISNVCLCDFTREEYCVYSEKGKVLNEKTANMLAKISVVHAQAGADIVAPAAMADGQVRHIRSALDEAGFDDIGVMSYIKTNSCMFQPFYKIMSQSKTPRTGIDASKFRVDVINERMFLQKADLEINDGVDIIIVKPGLPNLDLMLRLKQTYPTLSIAAYQVSGEYAMIEEAAEKGLLNKEAALMETLQSMKRAGADMIFSYHSVDAAKLLK